MSTEQIDWNTVDNSVSELSLDGQIHYGKVTDVYDGDTIKVCFPFIGQMIKWNCRLTGIDTPELRTKNEKEKKKGYEVRDALREKILNQMVYVHCEKFDKYGRLLTRVHTLEENEEEGECVNDWLVSEGHALVYDGGAKQSWTDILNN